MKKFHFSFGQAIALALVGLQVYAETQQPGSDAKAVLTNPQDVLDIAKGVASIFAAQPGTSAQGS